MGFAILPFSDPDPPPAGYSYEELKKTNLKILKDLEDLTRDAYQGQDPPEAEFHRVHNRTMSSLMMAMSDSAPNAFYEMRAIIRGLAGASGALDISARTEMQRRYALAWEVAMRLAVRWCELHPNHLVR